MQSCGPYDQMASFLWLCVSALYALSQHLPSYLGFSYLGCRVSLHSCSSKAQPLCWMVEQFYEDLQGLLEITPKKDVLFIIGDWNEKVGSQETPGIPCKFGHRVPNAQVIWNKTWVKIYRIFKQGIHFHSFREQKKEEKFLSICAILFHPCNNLGGKERWRQDTRSSVGTILSSQNRYNMKLKV